MDLKGDTMPVKVHEIVSDTYSTSGLHTTIRFLINNSDGSGIDNQSELFYMCGLPWRVSCGWWARSFGVSMVLHCKFDTSQTWNCNGTLSMKTVAVKEATASDLIPFKMNNSDSKGIYLYMDYDAHKNNFVGKIIVELSMNMIDYSYAIPNSDLKLSLHHIGKLMTTNGEIALNIEQLLQNMRKEVEHTEQDRRKIAELKEEVQRLEMCVKAKQDELDAEKLKSVADETTKIKELKEQVRDQEVELFAQKQANLMLIQRLKYLTNGVTNACKQIADDAAL